jgi:hypothetical protein
MIPYFLNNEGSISLIFTMMMVEVMSSEKGRDT